MRLMIRNFGRLGSSEEYNLAIQNIAAGCEVRNKMAIRRKLTVINLRSTSVRRSSLLPSLVSLSSRSLLEAAIFFLKAIKRRM